MLSPVVTKRYAEALLDAAKSANAIAAVEADLAIVAQAATDPRAVGLLSNPTAEESELHSRFMNPLLGLLKTRLVKNTVALLIARRRAMVLFHLASVYHRLALEAGGAAEGFIETATPLSPQELHAAEEAIGQRIHRKVTLAVHVDPTLLGGVRVTVGSQRFDATLRSRLSELRDRMLSAQL